MNLVQSKHFVLGTVCFIIACAGGLTVRAEQVGVSGKITISDETRSGHPGNSNVAVWLEPLVPDKRLQTSFPETARKHHFQLIQQNKRFEPHILIVPVGSEVGFPNKDVLFHSVFSMFNNQRFDLGLYEAGTEKTVTFDKPGISYIFCNIHAQMSATVIALETPYFAVSNKKGDFTIPGVPAGEYILEMWAEGASPDLLKTMRKIVTVSSASSNLGTFDLKLSPHQTAHKNKYDSVYDPASGASSYGQR